VPPLTRLRHLTFAPFRDIALGQRAQVAVEAGLEQVDRLALGGCRHVSADGAAADVQGRFRNDRTVEGGILVPRQGGGDPKNRPWRSARDVGERSCKGLAGVRRNGSFGMPPVGIGTGGATTGRTG